MRRSLPHSTLALCVITTFAAASCAGEPSARVEPVIFGADDRVEVYEVTNDALREAVIRAVPAMVRSRLVNIDASTGRVTFSSATLGVAQRLCAGEAHFDQPAAPSCSATLIDDDLVLTAGHCLADWPCADQRFVFGWYYDAAGMLHQRETADVFSCAEVIVSQNTATADYAIIRLDRPAPGPPIEVRRAPVVVSEPVSLAGYPFGIPMKVVETGVVTRVLTGTRFYARLDAQPGNSGSGVFDAELRLVGDLTNGPVQALTMDGDCNRLSVIGEDTTATELISSVNPAIDALCASAHPSARLCGELPDAGPFDAGMPDAALVPDAARVRDAARVADAAGDDAADGGPATPPAQCGCRMHAGQGVGAWWGMLAAALLVVRRRRSK